MGYNMARPIKKNADYFPHDNDMRNDPKIRALRTKFGPAGYATYCMMLETLTDSDEFRHPFSDIDKVLLAGDFGVEQELFDAIIGFSSSIIGVFVIDNDFISCPKLKERFSPLLEKREKQRKNSYRSRNYSYGSRNEVIEAETGVIDIGNTQSKVKESKVKKSIDSSYINKSASLHACPTINEHTKNDEEGGAGKNKIQEDEEEKNNKILNLFYPYFEKTFSVSLTQENRNSIESGVIRNIKQIEIDYLTVRIFLKTMAMRIQDIMKNKEINDPFAFFLSGAFGRDKYLWQMTHKEEQQGAGYHKAMIRKEELKQGGGVSLKGMTE